MDTPTEKRLNSVQTWKSLLTAQNAYDDVKGSTDEDVRVGALVALCDAIDAHKEAIGDERASSTPAQQR